MEIHELKIDRNFNNHLSNRVVCMLRAYREVYVPQNLFYLSALHAGEYVRSVVYVLVHVEQVSMRQLSYWDCLCYCGYTKADFETIASRLMPTKSIHNMS